VSTSVRSFRLLVASFLRWLAKAASMDHEIDPTSQYYRVLNGSRYHFAVTAMLRTPQHP